MKKILLLSLLFFSVGTLLAQNKNYNLRLKSQTFLPTENLSEFLLEPNLQNEFQGKYFKIIQFYDIPSQSQKQQIERTGIEILDFLPNYAFIAVIPNYYNLNQLKQFNIRSVIEFEAHLKIDDYLQKDELPAWALRTNNQIDLNILAYENLDKNVILSELKNQNVEVLYDYQNSNTFTIRADVSAIEKISNLPFVYFIEPVAPESEPDDIPGRSLHRSNVLMSQSSIGRKYDGSGVSVAIADDGGISHIDFQGRLTDLTANQGGGHGDMVSGICVGAGNRDPLIQGHASGAYLYLYDISGYNHVRTDAITNLNNRGVHVTSTSYSQGTGGQYTADTRFIDQQLRQNPTLIHIFSAGNAGTTNAGYGVSGWGNITGGFKAGKNVIASGNLRNTDQLENSSSRGPARDGRIKPDLCANGYRQLSTDENNTSQVGGGTSAASPSIAGVFTQLHHAYRDLNSGQTAEAALIKACLQNTAEDLGRPGPDFEHGWGRVNGSRAVKTMEENRYLSDSVSQGGTNMHSIDVPAGTQQVRIMIHWTDFEGNTAAAKALVNDLNMVVSDSTMMSYNPWILDPTPTVAALTTPAVRGVDDLNNTEQVTIDNPIAGTYTISVNGFQVPQGPQKYYLTYEFRSSEIDLTYPHGGEGFVPGENEMLRWDAHGTAGTFNLSYSTDSGSTWSTIGTAGTTARHYVWTVPNTVSGRALVRIQRGLEIDISDTTFTIVGLPSNIQVTAACPNSVTLKWDAVTGATAYEVSRLGAEFMDSVGRSNTDSLVVMNVNGVEASWYSVKAIVDGGQGRRATAISKPFGIFNCIVQTDAGVEIISPTGALLDCYPLDSIPISIDISNMGLDTINNLPVYYRLNGGTIVNDTFPGPLYTGQTANFIFNQTIDLSTIGAYNLQVWADLNMDGNPFNDTVLTVVDVLSGTLKGLPIVENFDNFINCSTANDCDLTVCPLANDWINVDNGIADDIDWRTDNGGTASNNTGPANGHTTGTGNDKYVYLEASNSCNNQVAVMISPCIDLRNASSPLLTYWYHMFGTTMGDLHVDIARNGVWTNSVSMFSGNQGNQWNQDSIDLTPFVGSIVNIRFRGITGSDFESDIALDDINIVETAMFAIDGYISSINQPANNQLISCQDNSNIGINVSVSNIGSDTLNNVPVFYQINSNPPVADTLRAMLLPRANVNFTFATLADLSMFTNFDLTVWTQISMDGNVFNDTLTKTINILAGTSLATPFTQDFESYNDCAVTLNCGGTICPLGAGWNNETNGLADDVDWRVLGTATASPNTGPTTDHTPGTGTKFIYLEASAGGGAGCENQVAHLVSPCIFVDTAMLLPELSFWYHMWGGNMGSLHLDVLRGDSIFLDVMPMIMGDQGNQWLERKVSLAAYQGQIINLRFRGIIGTGGFQSDMALDDINLSDGFGASFAIDGTPCQSNALTVRSTSSMIPNTTYAWDFGIGANPATANTFGPHQVTYNIPGTRTIQLIINNNGNMDTAQQMINVLPSAIADYNFVTSGTGKVDFTNASINASSYAWRFGDGTVSAVQNPSHTYLMAGMYNVELIAYNNNCSNDTITKTVSVTVGIEDIFIDGKILIYPNPSNGIFNLSMKDISSKKANVKVTDAQGKAVYNRQMNNINEVFETQIDLTKVSAGVYFLYLELDDKKYQTRLAIH